MTAVVLIAGKRQAKNFYLFGESIHNLSSIDRWPNGSCEIWFGEVVKKKIAVLAALASVVLSAHAQSSVTLYGIINEALTYSSNQGGSSAVQLNGNGEYGSRWGLKGSEDLGGGLKAIFTLESGFTPTTGALGQNSRMFGRQAFVGLSDTRYGSLTFGRQYDAIVGTLQTMTSNGAWGGVMMSHPYDNDNTDDFLRVNNSVKYVSPTIAGVTAIGMYAFSNDAGAFANNRMWSTGAIWSHGPFSVAAAYSLYDTPGPNTSATVNANGAITCCDAPIISKREQIAGGGASYQAGPVKLTLSYTNAIYNNVGTTLTSGVNYRFNNYEANAWWTVNPTLFMGVAYIYTSDNITGGGGGASTVHWNQANFLTDYYLSKRTHIYLESVFERSAGGKFAIAAGGPITALANGAPAAQIEPLSPSSSRNQFVLSVGLVHKF